MTALGIILTIFAIGGLIVLKIFRAGHEGKLEKMRINAQRRIRKGELEESEAEGLIAAETFWAPNWASRALMGTIAVGVVLAGFHGMFFYAEPSFQYHVRPLWGGEKVVSKHTGYAVKGFGRVNAWKIAMTVKIMKAPDTTGRLTEEQYEDSSGAEDDAQVSAVLPAERVVFLDQVDALGAATVRFKLPDDELMFLELVHEYRSPGNLLTTELIPATQETLQVTGQLMAAEKYFSGGQTEFRAEFADQIKNGIFLVERIEERVEVDSRRAKTADASADKQESYDEDSKVVFKVKKIEDPDTRLPIRKSQTFKAYGVTVLSARIIGMKPNDMFLTRMEDKQKASAQRAVNREQRIQEEEQKFLAIAKGARIVAEQQAEAKKVQIKATTDAETTKRLALIKANQQKERAVIDKETAQIKYEQAEIDAQKRERLADAEAYEKTKILEADNALDKKLAALVQIVTVQSKAQAQRPVPNTVIYQGGSGPTALGTATDVQAVADTQLLKNLKALDLSIGIAPQKASVVQ